MRRSKQIVCTISKGYVQMTAYREYERKLTISRMVTGLIKSISLLNIDLIMS